MNSFDFITFEKINGTYYQVGSKIVDLSVIQSISAVGSEVNGDPVFWFNMVNLFSNKTVISFEIPHTEWPESLLEKRKALPSDDFKAHDKVITDYYTVIIERFIKEKLVPKMVECKKQASLL